MEDRRTAQPTCYSCRYNSRQPSYCHLKDRHVAKSYVCDKWQERRAMPGMIPDRRKSNGE